MKGIGILPGFRPHYIDHLAPLCSLMEIPFLVTDPMIETLVHTFYPPMETIRADAEDYTLDSYLEPYDTFFYVDFSRMGSGTFQFHEFVSRKKARSVISLHGNPDKYHETYWLERLADEDIILAYGPQLASLLQKKGVTKKPILSGNYRLEFYKSNEHFFDSKLPFKKEKTTLLYAPTWSSKEVGSELGAYYSSFFENYKALFEGLKDGYQLLVKLHPLMIRSLPLETEEIMSTYPHICFLNEFPLVYPLLKEIDIYLGDYSSIGYDFLYFNRPLFFLDPPKKTPLHALGEVITKEEIFHLNSFTTPKPNKEAAYREAFGEKKELSELKKEIQNALT